MAKRIPPSTINLTRSVVHSAALNSRLPLVIEADSYAYLQITTFSAIIPANFPRRTNQPLHSLIAIGAPYMGIMRCDGKVRVITIDSLVIPWMPRGPSFIRGWFSGLPEVTGWLGTANFEVSWHTYILHRLIISTLLPFR